MEKERLLASASYDQTIRFWDIRSGSLIESITHKDSHINVMKVSPDFKYLAVAGWQHIRLYSLQGSPLSSIVARDNLLKSVTALGFEAAGKWLYTGGEDCTTKVWDFRCDPLHCQRIFQTKSGVNAVALHPNQVILIMSDIAGTLYFWDLRNNRNEHYTAPQLDGVNECIIHLDVNETGNTLCGVSSRGKMLTWSLGDENNMASTMHITSSITAHASFALKCRFSPDGSNIATAGSDGFVRIWNASMTNAPVASLSMSADTPKIKNANKDESDWVWDCVFTKDSKFLFTASGCQLRLWNLESQSVVRHYQGHNKTITAFTYEEFDVSHKVA